MYIILYSTIANDLKCSEQREGKGFGKSPKHYMLVRDLVLDVCLSYQWSAILQEEMMILPRIKQKRIVFEFWSGNANCILTVCSLSKRSERQHRCECECYERLEFFSLISNCTVHCLKEKKIILIYREIQKGSGAKAYSM